MRSLFETFLRYTLSRKDYPHLKDLGLFIILFGLAIAGCRDNRNESLIDRSFLTDQPCKAPCWYGLELDKSNRDNIYSTIKALPFVDQATVREWGTGWLDDETAREVHFDCLYPTPATTGCIGLTISHDKLKAIRMSVGFDLTFKTVVDKLGPPNYMNHTPWGGEIGGCVIGLFWPDRGISVEYIDTQTSARCDRLNQGKRVTPDTPVGGIFYTAKEGIRECSACSPWVGFSTP